jgi:general stress protein YciG
MAGTKSGGKLAAQTNKQRYGMNFYVVIGAVGGRASSNGGFAVNRALAVEAGRKGGKVSRRGKQANSERVRARLTRPPLTISKFDDIPENLRRFVKEVDTTNIIE